MSSINNNSALGNNLKALIAAMLKVDNAEIGFQGAVAALVPHMKASVGNRKAILTAIAAHYKLEVGPSQRDNDWGNITMKDGENFKRADNRWEYIKRAWRDAMPATPAKTAASSSTSGASDPVAALVGNVSKALAKMNATQRTRALKAIAKLA